MNYMNKSEEEKMNIIRAMHVIQDFYDCTDTGYAGLENWRNVTALLIPLSNELFESLSKENQEILQKEG